MLGNGRSELARALGLALLAARRHDLRQPRALEWHQHQPRIGVVQREAECALLAGEVGRRYDEVGSRSLGQVERDGRLLLGSVHELRRADDGARLERYRARERHRRQPLVERGLALFRLGGSAGGASPVGCSAIGMTTMPIERISSVLPAASSCSCFI